MEDSANQIVADAQAQTPEVLPQNRDELVAPQSAPMVPEPGPKAQLFDITGKTPVLGHINHDEVTDAVASGRFSFPKGSPVNVISPDGTHGTIDPHEAPEAFQNGYRYATPKDLDQAKYGDQTIAAGLEGLAQGVAGPLATLAETSLGISGPKDIRGRAEANPIAHGLGEGAGFLGSLATGVGEGALVAEAGSAISKGIEGAGLLSDAARGATKAATEMALLGTGDEISKMITQDPNQTVQSAITNIGLSATLGGLLGGTTSGASSLWKASGAGDKLGQIAADIQGRLKYHVGASTIEEAVTKELGDHQAYMQSMGDELKELAPGKAPEIMAHLDGLDKQLSKIKDVTKHAERVTEYLDAADKYKKFATKLYSRLEETPSLSPTSLSAAQGVTGATTDGAKMVDYFVKHAVNAGDDALGSMVGGFIGHTMGIPGGGTIGALIGQRALGPAFKSVTSALLKPLMESAANGPGFKAALDYGLNAAKGAELIGKTSANVFRMGAEVLSDRHVPTEADRMKLDKYLKVAQSKPGALLEGHSQGHYLPGHAAAAAQTAQNAVNYLNSKRPSEDKASPLDSKPIVNRAQKAEFHRTLDIAQQPLMVLKHIKEGTLVPSDIQTLQALYPQLHAKLAQELTNEMIKHIAKPGNTVPYKTRIGLSLFAAQPMDSTMTPAAIMAAQPQPVPSPQQGGAGRSNKSLTKLPGMYQTASQAREHDRSTKA